MNHQPCRLQGPCGLAVINHCVPWSTCTKALSVWVCCILRWSPVPIHIVKSYFEMQFYKHLVGTSSFILKVSCIVILSNIAIYYEILQTFLDAQIGSDIALLVSLNYHLSSLLREILTETEIHTYFYSAICICIFLWDCFVHCKVNLYKGIFLVRWCIAKIGKWKLNKKLHWKKSSQTLGAKFCWNSSFI